MSVIVGVSVPAESFALAGLFAAQPDASIEVDRLASHGRERVMPAVWLVAPDPAAAAGVIRGDPAVDVEQRERLDGGIAYATIRWGERVTAVVDAIVDRRGVVEAASATESARELTLKFSAREAVADFQAFADERDLELELRRLAEASTALGRAYGLTPEQREALETALDLGYFDVPRGPDRRPRRGARHLDELRLRTAPSGDEGPHPAHYRHRRNRSRPGVNAIRSPPVPPALKWPRTHRRRGFTSGPNFSPMTDHDTGRPPAARRSARDVRRHAATTELSSHETGPAERHLDGEAGGASDGRAASDRDGAIDVGPGARGESVRISDVFEVLGHRDRRVVLSALCATDGDLDVDALAGELVRRSDAVSPSSFDGVRIGDSPPDSAASAGALRSARISLVHNHLPRLVAAGLVRFDRDENRVQPTDAFQRIESALDTILETGASVER